MCTVGFCIKYSYELINIVRKCGHVCVRVCVCACVRVCVCTCVFVCSAAAIWSYADSICTARDMTAIFFIIFIDELLLQFTVMTATKEPKPSYHAVYKGEIVGV